MEQFQIEKQAVLLLLRRRSSATRSPGAAFIAIPNPNSEVRWVVT
jgi:hypothetical protein